MDTLTLTYPNFISSSTLPKNYKTARSVSTGSGLSALRSYVMLDFMKPKSLSFPQSATTTDQANALTIQLTTEIEAQIDPETSGWLKLAESNFSFWDNESDAYFDSL
jgi:hypothetical protein